jgi:hypothetical protein
MDKTKKNLIIVEGFISEITQPKIISLADGKKFTQAIMTFDQFDGQRTYFEVRKKIIEQYQASAIAPDTKVRVGFVMLGINKNGNLFNKLYINTLELI